MTLSRARNSPDPETQPKEKNGLPLQSSKGGYKLQTLTVNPQSQRSKKTAQRGSFEQKETRTHLKSFKKKRGLSLGGTMARKGERAVIGTKGLQQERSLNPGCTPDRTGYHQGGESTPHEGGRPKKKQLA